MGNGNCSSFDGRRCSLEPLLAGAMALVHWTPRFRRAADRVDELYRTAVERHSGERRNRAANAPDVIDEILDLTVEMRSLRGSTCVRIRPVASERRSCGGGAGWSADRTAIGVDRKRNR